MGEIKQREVGGSWGLFYSTERTIPILLSYTHTTMYWSLHLEAHCYLGTLGPILGLEE